MGARSHQGPEARRYRISRGAIFQGGEKHEIAGLSFVAQVNYAEALDKQHARVVSCNTTALCRVLHALHRRATPTSP